VLRLLVVEGNTATDRRRIAEFSGAAPGESYARVLSALAPDAHIDICTPADADASAVAPIDSYDGVAITGSALNIYKREAASLRQVDFMREIFARGVPAFGSCWGLQLAAVAAGGEVGPNPLGPEVAFARKIILTDAGRDHPMHAGRPPVFDAPAIHSDELLRLPENAVVTAWSAMSKVQAAEIRCGEGLLWGVQYHPEYDLRDLATTILRYGARLVDEGFFSDKAALERYAADLESLGADSTRRDIAWRLGVGDDILRVEERRREIANWIDRRVRPDAKH
jgi:GMP synthase (glutamine-hydrolysing)